MKRLLLFLFPIIFLVSCSSGNGDFQKYIDKTDLYYKYVMTSNYDSVVTLFSPEFFKHTDTSEFLDQLKKNTQPAGNIKSKQWYKAVNSSEINTQGNSERIIISYKVDYNINKVAKEIFTFKSDDHNALIYSLAWENWKDED